MRKIRVSILCAAVLSMIFVPAANAQEKVYTLENKVNTSQNNTSNTENVKNLVNLKENNAKNNDDSELAEVLIKNKVYSVTISKSQSAIEELINQNRLEEAKQLCQQKLKSNPSDQKARVFLGNVYSLQYKLDAARSEYQKVLNKNPNNAEAHHGLGLIYYKKTSSSDMDIRRNIDRYYQEALKEFEFAIKSMPDYYQAYNSAGKIMHEIGKIDEAEKYYRKSIDIEPKYSEALENLGIISYTKNQPDEALKYFKDAISSNKKNSSAYYHVGEVLISKGEYSKAINSLQTSLYLNPNSAPVHDMLGKAYQKQGNEAAAITEFKKSTLIKPEYSYPYLRLANIYQDRGDDELAISELKTAISINSDFLEGKQKIADISLKTGKTDQAIKYYREVMGNKNFTNSALKGLSKAYFMKAQEISNESSLVSESEYTEAEKAIKQAIQFNPDDIQLYLALLRISRLVNKDGQSDLYLNKIIDSPMSRPIDHVVKGEAYITYKKYFDAQYEFRSAIDNVNKIDDILYLGEIFITNRQYPAAKEAFNKALSMDSNNLKAIKSLERIQKNEGLATSKFNVARGFYNTRQTTAAIEALRDCISLNPYMVEAQLLLAKSFEKEKYYFNAIEHYTAYINLLRLDGQNAYKYEKRVSQLKNKVQKIQESGKPIKKFTRI